MLNELMMLHPVCGWLVLGFFFLCVGSFLNVVIYRLPLMLKAEWARDCHELFACPIPETSSVNLCLPRSFCPQCKTMIKAWQNIPILSYLFLRGRCHHCQASISARYPLIELVTLLLSLFACYHFGLTLKGMMAVFFVWISICMVMIDVDEQLLPDNLTLGLLWLGLLANTQGLFTTLPNAVMSAAGAYLGLWLFIQLFYVLTGKIGMGHGDFKLFAALGAWLGWQMLPLILLLASLAGAIFGVIYLRLNHQNRDTPIPFGPFLAMAGFVALFWGSSIWNWYWEFVGLPQFV